MEQRINFFEKGANAFKSLYGISGYLAKSSIEQHLLELVSFRVSQINGCAYCLDMHSKDLRANGETEQRLYMMDAWRESPVYTKRERTAFAWAEAVNKMDVPDEVYELAHAQFSDEELIDLTMGVIAINTYNRINITFRTPAGGYTPGMHAVKTA